MPQKAAPYDAFADFYNRDWATDYHSQLMPILDRLLLSDLVPGDSILDIGCGTGQVAAQLTTRGFRVTGMDQSESMLELARQNAPQARFTVGDACDFELPVPHQAAIATFEAVNHILDSDALARSFACACRAIETAFVFDMIEQGAFELFWNGRSVVEQDGIECQLESHYDPVSKMAACHVSVQGRHTVIRERCYEQAEVKAWLRQAGFSRVNVVGAARDCGMTGDVSVGRVFYQCFR